MKLHVKFKVDLDKGFDIVCTHFEFCCLSGLISVWNGVLDTPHLFEASNFIYVDFIDPSEAGTNFVCYNNISAALEDFNIKEVGII